MDGSAADVWMRHLENGDIAVAMFNMTDSEKSGFFPFVAAGINSSCSCVLDFCELYTDEKMFEVRDELVTEPIPPHGCKIYRAEVRHCPAQKITVVDTTAVGGNSFIGAECALHSARANRWSRRLYLPQRSRRLL